MRIDLVVAEVDVRPHPSPPPGLGERSVIQHGVQDGVEGGLPHVLVPEFEDGEEVEADYFNGVLGVVPEL